MALGARRFNDETMIPAQQLRPLACHFCSLAKLNQLGKQFSETSLYQHNCVSYRASAKWAAFTGSCSSRRASWFARAVQLLAMLRMITSD
jgi:hypothetical protein